MLFCAVGFVFFDRLAIAFLFPFISDDLGLNNTELGLIMSVLGLTWALSGPLLGFASNRIGKKTMLVVMISLFSIMSFLSGIVAGFISLLVFRALMGIAEGPVLPVAQAVMSLESSESRRGFNMGFIQSTAASVFGGILAPLIIVNIANAYGWRFAFYTTIIPGIILVFVIAKWMREPKEKVLTTIADAKDEEKVRIGDVLKNRNIVFGLIIACANITWYIMIVTFTPTYLMDGRGMTAAGMSLAVVGLGIGGAIWGFGTPALSDRIGRKPATIIFSFISILSPLAIVYLPASVALIFIALIIVHVGQGIIPIYMSIIPAESVPIKYVAAAVGLLMGVGEVFGGVIMPIVAGRLADTWTPAAPFYIAAVGAAIAGLLAFGLVETAPAVVKKRAGLPEVAEQTAV